MNGFDKQAAEQAIDALRLARANGELAARWFALWQDDALPPRARFRPVNFKRFLPNIALFSVVPDRRVTVRLAGTRFAHVLGQDVTGMDWIAAAPEQYRPRRLAVLSQIARGAILIDNRRFATTDGEDYVSEEILLPFAPDANGVVPVLAHADLPVDRFVKVKSLIQVFGEPEDVRVVTLRRVEETPEVAKVA